MYFSPKTIMAVAGLLATASAAPAGDAHSLPHAQHERNDVSLAQRGLFDWWWQPSSNVQLCYKPNYGAIGKPWESGSTPGSFCGKNKPRNDGKWRNIVLWDGGDSVKCSNWLSRWGINVCTGGNYRKPLPWNCRPPKKNRPPKTTKTVTATATVTTTGVTTVTTTATTTVTADTPAPTDDDPYKDPVCSANYQQMFDDYKPPADPNNSNVRVGAATVDNENYIHYTLASDPNDCLAACDQTEGCVFVNSYIDYDPTRLDNPKHQAGVYTCSFYRACPGVDKNTNYGGQGDGAVILNSDGWCKSGACGGR